MPRNYSNEIPVMDKDTAITAAGNLLLELYNNEDSSNEGIINAIKTAKKNKDTATLCSLLNVAMNFIEGLINSMQDKQ